RSATRRSSTPVYLDQVSLIGWMSAPAPGRPAMPLIVLLCVAAMQKTAASCRVLAVLGYVMSGNAGWGTARAPIRETVWSPPLVGKHGCALFEQQNWLIPPFSGGVDGQLAPQVPTPHESSWLAPHSFAPVLLDVSVVSGCWMLSLPTFS